MTFSWCKQNIYSANLPSPCVRNSIQLGWYAFFLPGKIRNLSTAIKIDGAEKPLWTFNIESFIVFSLVESFFNQMAPQLTLSCPCLRVLSIWMDKDTADTLLLLLLFNSISFFFISWFEFESIHLISLPPWPNISLYCSFKIRILCLLETLIDRLWGIEVVNCSAGSASENFFAVFHWHKLHQPQHS